MCSSEVLRGAGLLSHRDKIWQLHFALWTWSCASSWRKVPSHRKTGLFSCWDTWIRNAMSSVASSKPT